jgi:type II secretion system protein G
MNLLINGVTILVIAVCTPPSADEADHQETVKKQAQAMIDAYLAEDYEKLVDLTYPKLVEMLGGREKMITWLKSFAEQAESKGVKLHSMKLTGPAKIAQTSQEIVAVVPTVMELEAKIPGRFKQPSFLIGVSSDDGKTWTFLEGLRVDAERLKKLLPEFPKELKLPKVQRVDLAKLAHARLTLVVLQQVLLSYHLDVGCFPTTAQGLEALRERPPEFSGSGEWYGPYINKSVPLDPWGNPYQYEYATGDKQPKIWSLGPDSVSGTVDDVVADD